VYSVLLIEDDPSIAKGLTISLEAEHYEVVHHTDGDKGYHAAQFRKFDVILLDLILPGRNGEDICTGLRAKGISTPILMVTSKKDEVDRVMGLDIGADDYVTKPFSLLELHARIRALLRRPPELKLELDTYSFGNVFVDLKRLEVKKNNTLVQLSKKEMDILHYFLAHEGEVITRDMLLDHVWGYETYPVTRTVDNFILALRKKLEDDPKNPSHLLTVPTAGYKFQKGVAV
jgi:DNA-binding response OmpR family regulator